MIMQEALISHGCTKAEAAAAEQLYKSLAFKPENPDSPFCLLPSAAQRGKTSGPVPGSSSRDALAASSADADAASAAVSSTAKDSGAASARGGAAAGAKGVAAAAVGASPREANIDYAMFEQLWMADLTSSLPRAAQS